MDLISLQQQAIELFPMPIGACVWVRMRVEFKRERWVKQQIEAKNKTHQSIVEKLVS